MKKLNIAYRSYGPGGINNFGGGEGRWLVNTAHFLQSEGHNIHPMQEGRDQGYDVYLDPGFENRACFNVKAPKHIHFRFCGPWDPDHVSGPCFHSGNCIATGPYRQAYELFDNFPSWKEKGLENTIQRVYIPVPYQDDLLPEHSKVPGFERKGVFWGTKDPFHPVFAKEYLEKPGGHGWKIVNGGLCTLRALLRLQEKTDFTMFFVMAHHLREAPPELGVMELIGKFRSIGTFKPITPYTELVSIMSHCKLNVPSGGLWGSSPEAIYAGCLPMMPPNNQFYEHMDIMPCPVDQTVDNTYDALALHWFDKEAYEAAHAPLQERFEDHRTPGLRKHIYKSFEDIGVL